MSDRIRSLICKTAECELDTHIEELASLWAEVVDQIASAFWDEVGNDDEVPHINLREEMVERFAEILLMLEEQVVRRRLAERCPTEIRLQDERAILDTDKHRTMVKNTVCNLAELWRGRMAARWLPKTQKMLEREKAPRKTKLAVIPRENNHFISKFLLRDFWAANGKIAIYDKTAEPLPTRRLSPFSQWGYGKRLYTDAREAWFALIEGDAKRPIEMLLGTRPLNTPQRDAFLGYLIVQLVRTPVFKDRIVANFIPLIEEHVGSEEANSHDYRNRVFETLFENNNFYHELSHPLMWSKWVLIESSTPCFALPDIAAATGIVDEQRALIAPLTPNVCFVATGIPEDEKRIVPHRFTDNRVPCHSIAGCMAALASDSYISHPNHDLRDVIDEGAIGFADVVRAVRLAMPAD